MWQWRLVADCSIIEAWTRVKMTVYWTKVWNYNEPVGPLQFSAEGWREDARNKLEPGDLVVLVGTKGEPTQEGEQGRVLGLMEPTRERVLSLDFDLPTRPEDFDDRHNYKWPYGLLNRHAWRIIDREPLEVISSRPFYMDAVLWLVALRDAEAAKVMALRREPA